MLRLLCKYVNLHPYYIEKKKNSNSTQDFSPIHIDTFTSIAGGVVAWMA